MARKFGLAKDPLSTGPTIVERQGSGIPYRQIPIAAIVRDTNQPRVYFEDSALNELASSIKEYGVLAPLLVRPGKTPGKYNLVSGERRFRASKIAGLSAVPAIVDTADDDGGARTLAIQLVENIQRQNLTSLEKSHAIDALKAAYDLSIREIARRLGISKSSVQRSLDLLDLPDDLLNALRQGAPESKILALSKISDPKRRSELLASIDNLTRTEIEALGPKKTKKSSGKAKNKQKAKSPEDVRLIDEMQKALGLKVNLVRSSKNNEKGKITVDFYSETDLQAIFRAFLS